MRIPTLLIVAALLTACAHNAGKYHTAPVKAPSLGEIGRDVGRAEAANEEATAANAKARAAAGRLDAGMAEARGYAKRIDDKATVVLKYLK